jgi:putative lipoprotein (rSAM/lipoprotein system)
MKKIKAFLLKKNNSLISFLLTILGFGAVCSFNGCMYGDPVVEYGTPFATFKINGNVKSEVTSNAIPNIRVVMGYDTTYTDGSGNYQISNTEFPDDQTFLLEFKDVDGETNAEYQPLDTIVEFIDPEFSGGTGSWDRGETEKEVNVKLKDIE